LQQTPCAQKPESHSFAIAHVVPIGLSVQMLALHMLGATQSAAWVVTVQPVRQAPPAMSQVYLPQGVEVAAPHTPAPSHTRADAAVVVLVQTAAAHCVPLTCLRQAPAPLQVPSLPHVDAAAAGHCEATSGGAPGAIGEQVPTLPAIEQDMQVPVQALLQQTLLTQKFDAQSEPIPDGQDPPIGILPQLMLTQLFPDTQSAAEVVQDILQAPVPHRYGAQGLMVAARHTPAPSHERGDDSVEPVQLAAPQDVLAAYLRHAPAPLHLPSVPHDIAPMSVHCVAGVGAVFAGTGEHVPTDPVKLQLMQVAAHPVLQQTPCSQ
jgi:hypothetical protein